MPSPSSVHTNEALSGFATSYSNGVYYQDFICPPIPTDKWSDTVYQRSRADVITTHDDRIGANTEPSEVDYEVSTTTYNCVDRGHSAFVPYKTIQNADDPLRPRMRRVETILNAVMLNAEVRVADALNTTTSYASANRITATAAWSNKTSADIVKDMQDAIAALPPAPDGATEIRCVMALELWQEAQRHPQLLGLLGGDDRGLISTDQFEAFFSLPGRPLKLRVSDAQKNTANRGASSPTPARVWDTDKVVLARVPAGEPDADSMMFAGRFRVRYGSDLMQASMAGENDAVVTEWDEPSRGPGAGVLGVKVTRSESDTKVLQNDMGAIIHSA